MCKVKTLIKSIAFVAGVVFSMPSSAYVINGTTDVGDVDSIVAMTALPDYSVAGEKAWVESVLGENVTIESRQSDANDWTAVDGQVPGSETIFAQLLNTNPDYFMLRIFNGSVNGNNAVLYENFAQMSYAVIDLVALGGGSTFDIFGVSVSHITSFNVPEPGPLALFGFGLLGLLVARKGKKTA